MSYCRFSSLNGYCDVYVYEDVFGLWTIHVASKRQPPGAPAVEMSLLVAGEGENHPAVKLFVEQNKLYEKWHSKTKLEQIDHPDAGASFHHGTPGECADNLERLQKAGFIIPMEVIQTLRREHDEGRTSET